MPRHGRPDDDPGGFLVPDLANDQHLGVLAEQMPGRDRKGQSARLADLGLHDARDHPFGGVFDRDHVASAQAREMRQARVNGGGLAAAGGPGQQDQPGGPAQAAFQLQPGRLGQAEVFERFGGRFREEAQHDFLPGDRRVSRHANVVGRADVAAADPPVLGHRILVGFEFGQVFDPAKHPVGGLPGDGRPGGHDAVEPEAHPQAGLLAPEVNVARAGFFSLADQLPDNAGGVGLGWVRCHEKSGH